MQPLLDESFRFERATAGGASAASRVLDFLGRARARARAPRWFVEFRRWLARWADHASRRLSDWNWRYVRPVAARCGRVLSSLGLAIARGISRARKRVEPPVARAVLRAWDALLPRVKAAHARSRAALARLRASLMERDWRLKVRSSTLTISPPTRRAAGYAGAVVALVLGAVFLWWRLQRTDSAPATAEELRTAASFFVR